MSNVTKGLEKPAATAITTGPQPPSTAQSTFPRSSNCLHAIAPAPRLHRETKIKMNVSWTRHDDTLRIHMGYMRDT